MNCNRLRGRPLDGWLEGATWRFFVGQVVNHCQPAADWQSAYGKRAEMHRAVCGLPPCGAGMSSRDPGFTATLDHVGP
jgi:hypothetical protein